MTLQQELELLAYKCKELEKQIVAVQTKLRKQQFDFNDCIDLWYKKTRLVLSKRDTEP